MADALEVLREVDRHFQVKTGLAVPGQIYKPGAFEDCHPEPYDLWRRVRHAIKELENDRERLRSGAATGDGGSNDRPAPAPAVRRD